MAAIDQGKGFQPTNPLSDARVVGRLPFRGHPMNDRRQSDQPREEPQAHPLHDTDRNVVDRLLAVERPGDGDLVDLGRLLMRYEGFPGADDLQRDLAKCLGHWGLGLEQLHQRTRAIWAAGHRPGMAAGAEAVGSGFDTAAQDTP
jgi:hypothetical protein